MLCVVNGNLNQMYYEQCKYSVRFVIASADGEILTVNDSVKKMPPAVYIDLKKELYELRRSKEIVFAFKGGTIYIADLVDSHSDKYHLFGVRLFKTEGKYRRGDLIAGFVATIEKPGFFTNAAEMLRRATKPTEIEAYDFAGRIIRKLDEEEAAIKKIADEQLAQKNEQAKRDNEKAEYERAAALREVENKRIKAIEDAARIARENEALKDRLKIENDARMQREQIETEALERRLRIQTDALEEESRLTLEILRAREKIERVDMDGSNKTVESLLDALKGKK